VDEEKWISQEKFNSVLSFYNILPGPTATQLCCYFGLIAGGKSIISQRISCLLAGFGFMIPGFFIMILLSFLYGLIDTKNVYIQSVLLGIQPAVASMIFKATHKIAEGSLKYKGDFNVWLLFFAVISAIESVLKIPFLNFLN
jgi:chromate transporter